MTDASVSATDVVKPLEYDDKDSLREAQLAAPTIGPLLRGREAGERPNPQQLRNVSRESRRLLQLWDQLVVSGGVLCRQYESPDGSCVTLQIIVPCALPREVLAELHADTWGQTKPSLASKRGSTGQASSVMSEICAATAALVR